MIKTNDKEVWTSEPDAKRLHRNGKETYFIKAVLLQGETAESFEEVNISDIPIGPTMNQEGGGL